MQAQPVTIGRMTYNIFEDEEDDLADLEFDQRMKHSEQLREKMRLEVEAERKIVQEKINKSCEELLKVAMELKMSGKNQETEPSKVMETAKKIILFIFLAFPVIAYKKACDMNLRSREFIANRFVRNSFRAYDNIV